MKKIFLMMSLFFVGSIGFSQINFNTGSTDLDADLNAINTNAKSDPIGFKSDLSVSFGVPSSKIDLMVSMEMELGEMYLALEIAKIANKPIDEVLKCYKTNKDKGWGFIAKEMGIKPGSPEFHELKGKSKEKKEKGKSNSKGNNNSKGNSSGGNKPGKKSK